MNSQIDWLMFMHAFLIGIIIGLCYGTFSEGWIE